MSASTSLDHLTSVSSKASLVPQGMWVQQGTFSSSLHGALLVLFFVVVVVKMNVFEGSPQITCSLVTFESRIHRHGFKINHKLHLAILAGVLALTQNLSEPSLAPAPKAPTLAANIWQLNLECSVGETSPSSFSAHRKGEKRSSCHRPDGYSICLIAVA